MSTSEPDPDLKPDRDHNPDPDLDPDPISKNGRLRSKYSCCSSNGLPSERDSCPGATSKAVTEQGLAPLTRVGPRVVLRWPLVERGTHPPGLSTNPIFIDDVLGV